MVYVKKQTSVPTMGKFKNMGRKLGNVSKCAKNWKIQLEFEKVCQKGRRHDQVCKKKKNVRFTMKSMRK